MTLANIVLQKLSEAKPATGRHELAFADDASGWSLYLVADRTDELSVLVWEISLRRAESKGDVATRAQQIVEKCGALDSLKTVEVDVPRKRALLRSATPARRKEKIFYHEVILEETGSASLRRFKASNNGKRREQTAFALTHEALGRLVEELTA